LTVNSLAVDCIAKIQTLRSWARLGKMRWRSLMNTAKARFSLMFALAAAPAFAAMTLTSTDFASGAALPAVHIYPRCGGRNVSPQLSWSGVPSAAKSLVLTMIDVDVKPAQWSHWIVVDLPVDSDSLSRGTASLPGAARAIVSNFGDAAYDGPCPPQGTGTHHYEFTIWAMPTTMTSLAADENATRVTAFLSQHTLERASLSAVVQAPVH
jgi:Raf kinase inhibitor-like YbhB/YbcL family protein